ncbi:MAG: hypothetical protein RLZZ175_119 [Bacteroidota bacterium]|jgi:putative redox protein
MKVTLARKNDAVHFVAKNEQNVELAIDGSPEIGGKDLGFRPMQMLLAGLGGCSGIDIVNILKKQRQQLDEFDIEIDGQREVGVEPSLFKDIHVIFKLKGPNLDENKVKKAVELSMDKYCSVAKTLESSAKITYEFQINS